MNRIDRYVLGQFVPILIISLLFFVLVIQLIELLNNLVQFIERDIPFSQMMLVQYRYLPRSLSYSLPIGMLFACSFTIGTLYGSNEIIATLSAGIPIRRTMMPLLAVGLLVSYGGFQLEERLVIEWSKEHLALRNELFSINPTLNNDKVAALFANGRTIYYADAYNNAEKRLSGVIILERDDDGRIIQRVDAREARWQGEFWRLLGITVYFWNETGNRIISNSIPIADAPLLTLPPETFQRGGDNEIADLQLVDAKAYLESLESAGLPNDEEATEYYSRYSFPLTSFVVVLIASAFSGQFRKNVLLMSLLVSLCLSVVYYATGLMMDVLASNGHIHPIAAAWGAFSIFLAIGVIQFSRTRS